MNHMKKFLILILIVSVIIGLAISQKIKKRYGSLSVITSPAKTMVIENVILASGNIVFDKQVGIRPEVAGRVVEILVEEGGHVSKSQILLKLDPVTYIADLENAKSEVQVQEIDIEYNTEVYHNLVRQLNHQIHLLSKNVSHQEAVDNLRSQVKIAAIKIESAKELLNQKLARLTQAENNLKKTVFTSPIDGIITSLDIKIGETVIPSTINIAGSQLMTLSDPKTVFAELRVDEADIENTMVNQDVKIYTASKPKIAATGKVYSIGSSARKIGENPGLVFEVKVLLDNKQQTFYSGTSCRAEITVSSSDMNLAIPISSIQYEEQSHYVWLVKNSTVYKQEVTIGASNDTYQAVLSGLTESDNVITGPARIILQLESGATVSVEPETL